MKPIRHQTPARSPLVRAAERGLAKPVVRLPRPRPIPRPLDFMIDGTACVDDDLTERMPRTTRESFGHYASHPPLSDRVTFIHGHRVSRRGAAAVALMLVVLVLAAWGGR